MKSKYAYNGIVNIIGFFIPFLMAVIYISFLPVQGKGNYAFDYGTNSWQYLRTNGGIVDISDLNNPDRCPTRLKLNDVQDIVDDNYDYRHDYNDSYDLDSPYEINDYSY